MESLRADGVGRAFPLALDPFSCTRFEMADFAVAARDLGVNYVGICCGAGPHHVRAMAEALGRTVPASKYSPSMDLHPILGAAAASRDPGVLGSWNVTPEPN
jgi:betaine-homocysteine S-methyltransferase